MEKYYGGEGIYGNENDEYLVKWNTNGVNNWRYHKKLSEAISFYEKLRDIDKALWNNRTMELMDCVVSE